MRLIEREKRLTSVMKGGIGTSIVADVREKSEYLKEHCDEEWLLDAEEASPDISHPYSFDFLVITEKTGGTHHKPEMFRVERKRWSDFVQSMVKGYLDRQLSYVDILIIEVDPFDWASPPPQKPGQSDEAYERKVEIWEQRQKNAGKHAARIACNMPVWWSWSEEQTMDLLRYLERYDDKLRIRKNEIMLEKYGSDYQLRLLSSLPYVTPDRWIPERKEKMGEILRKHVDWEALADALNLSEWMEEDMGPRSIRVGRASGIRERLLREEEE